MLNYFISSNKFVCIFEADRQWERDRCGGFYLKILFILTK